MIVNGNNLLLNLVAAEVCDARNDANSTKAGKPKIKNIEYGNG
jgi:hypothetical protein